MNMMSSHFGTILATVLACATVCALAGGRKLLTADFPQTVISNGQLRVKLYLPDAKIGYYRGTRFDWSGVISSLEYKGHNFYGPWFDRMDPKIHDFDCVGAEVVAGPCTAALGPVEEFQTKGKALGWDAAKPGGTFIKIGVGVLRKDDGDYDAFKLYEIVDAGRWRVKQNPDSVAFTQEVSDPPSGYGYNYRKTVRLTQGKPEMVLEHSLKNTGRHTIQSEVYNHNFLVLDNQPPGPDFSISVPFQIHSSRPPDKVLAQIQGDHIVFSKVLENEDVVFIVLQGFGASPKDHDIRIENRKAGAGMRIRGDRPLSSENFWTMRRVLAMEPFIAMTINPGSEFTWKTSYEYYTLPANTQ
jgi:hypothetical protein